MSAPADDLEDPYVGITAFCVPQEIHLTEVWAEIEHTLCDRDKHKPPKILIDLRHCLFREHGFELDFFADNLSHGLWSDIINDGGRLALVVGTPDNVCVCGKLELRDMLADVSRNSAAIGVMETQEEALNWLAGGEH